MALTFTASFAAAQVVDIPDEYLRANIEVALNKDPGDAITIADMQTLTLLSAVNAGIQDLTGLEHATNLVWLDLEKNAISDITPLLPLTQLASLYLYNNPLSAETLNTHLPMLQDSGVVVFKTLLSDVNSDGIVNIQDLVFVTQHFGGTGDLTADVNKDGIVNIQDLTQVASNIGNTQVNAATPDTTDATDAMDTAPGEEQVRDHAFIFREFINLLISDLRSVVTSYTDEDFQPPGRGFHIPDRGNVGFRPANYHISGVFVPDPIMTTTLQQINRFSAQYNLTHTELIYLLDHLRRAAILIGDPVYHVVVMPDMNLREAVVAEINKLGISLGPINRPKIPSDPIYAGEMRKIKQLNAYAAGIESLQGLEYATDLETLRLGHNHGQHWDTISSVENGGFSYKVTEPVTPNKVSDLSPLENLTNLRNLDLGFNAVSRLFPLRYLTNLKRLNLVENQITDISPLADLTNLEYLYLSNHYYSPEWAGNNKISDLSPLRNLINLRRLDVHHNPIRSSIDIVRNFTKLKQLNIGCCGVSNLQPIVECPGLRGEGSNVYLVYSPLSDPDLPAIIGLENRGVRVEPGVQYTYNNLGTRVGIKNNFVERCSLSYRESLRAAPALQSQVQTKPDILASLWHDLSHIPEETTLMPNYPNPFNPETWIPYQLATPADITVAIHAADGRLVRTLAFGYQTAGVYKSKGRAAYWDGRNAQGEPVASGIYFYTLMAGDFTATRKLLIQK